mgnify:CR=1 FL=1
MANILKEKSFDLALNIIQISKDLQNKNEYVLSKQLLRSGTAIGALVRESQNAESSKDFINFFEENLIEPCHCGLEH